ncbi:MAG: hypothetical protein EPO26_02960 [Chloroflexota bacterium]|nr:MAG: hypothetical protein EPO26_02960 [Chloroflexota bacterium]
MEPRQVPGQTPLAVYRDSIHGLALLYPDWWQAFDSPTGKLFSPGNLDTFISLEASSLGMRVAARDLPELEKGFLTGLRNMPDSELLSHEVFDGGIVLGLDARQRYDGKKRWVRLLYRGELQVRLIAQGATEPEFDFWLPSFNPAMTSFVFDAIVMPTESY